MKYLVAYTKHVNVFLHDCANVIWSLKGTESFHLSTLVSFLCKKLSITIQRMQTPAILSRVIAIGLTTYWLPPFQNTPPIIATIASRPFLTCKYGRPSTSDQLWTCIDFHNNFEPTWHLVISPFPIFYSLVHFPNLRCVYL